jgi:hypothetical protein
MLAISEILILKFMEEDNGNPQFRLIFWLLLVQLSFSPVLLSLLPE